jgi:hypothetical protein
MRPYLAVIKDSFREALASRVLWVLTGLIGLFLVLIAPIGYKLNLTGEFAWGDIAEPGLLAEELRKAGAAEAATPGKRIWSLLDESTRTTLEKIERPSEDERRRERDPGEFLRVADVLRKGLNKLLTKRDLYRDDDWKGVSLPKEANELLARPRDSLSSEESVRLNRLLVESPFPGRFSWRSPQSLSFTYGWFASPPAPLTKQQVDTFIKNWVLTSAMYWIVGIVGLIAAILVTSGVVPQMFEPGSITLLLSKPISRSLLFSAKFVSACAFVFVNVTFLIVGLWLIAGLRFQIWNQGMLWCIPVFVLMFLVYYAVSAISGLVWKSPIISVVVTVLFWAVCFGVNFLYEVMHGLVIERQRITRMVEADGGLLCLNEAGTLHVWDVDERQWRETSEPRGGPGEPKFHGPYYHSPSKQLVVGQGFSDLLGFASPHISLRVAGAGDGWKLRDGPTAPSGIADFVIANDNTIFAVAADNIFRFRGDPAVKKPAVRVFGIRLPLTGGGEFQPCLSGERPTFADPVAVAADPAQPRIVICAANSVYIYSQEADGKLILSAERALAGSEKVGTAIAVGGDSVLIAREEGQSLLLSTADLSVKKELSLEATSQPRFVSASCDGTQFAVLFQNRYLWFVDSTTGEARRAPVPAQGQISGVLWTPDRLLIADYANRVVAYDLETMRHERVYRPALTRWELAHYYIVEPLYTIFPKPRGLHNTVAYLLTGKQTTDAGLFQGDVTQYREDLHPWRPVTSGLAFVGVLLLLACVYIERHEF